MKQTRFVVFSNLIIALQPPAQSKPNNSLSWKYYFKGEESQSLLQHLWQQLQRVQETRRRALALIRASERNGFSFDFKKEINNFEIIKSVFNLQYVFNVGSCNVGCFNIAVLSNSQKKLQGVFETSFPAQEVREALLGHRLQEVDQAALQRRVTSGFWLKQYGI